MNRTSSSWVRGASLVAWLFAGLIAAGAPSLSAQPPEGASPAKTAGTTNLEAESEGTGAAEPTAAERYASVRRLLEADRARLVELQAEAKKLETEFETASAEFSRLDGELQAARVKVTAATNAADREAAAAQVAALEGDWTPSRDAFDIVIQHRKAIAKQIETLTDKIRLEESFLQQMSTADENAAKPAGMEGTAALPGVGTSPAPEGSPAPTASGAATGMVAPTAPAVTNPPSAQNGTPAPSGATPPAAAPAVPSLIPGIPGLPVPAQTAGTSAAPSATSAGAAPVGTAEAALLTAPISDTAPNEELIAARREAQAKESALQLARRRVEGLNQAIEVFERDQNATQDVFEAAQRELEVAKSAEIAIIERMKDASEKGVAAEELVKLEERRRQVEQRLDEARREVELQTARLVESSDAVKHLKTLRTAAIEKVAEAEKAVAPARSRVWYLESPITPTRLWNWAIDVGPKLIGIVVLMTALWYLARLVASRQVMSFVLRGRRGSTDERESRANTLRLVFENSVGVAILLIGALAILDQLGVNVTVLLGGAAVLGAAIAFGSQNLIKDFFSGFMILVENQYSVGNIVRIGDVSGSVEDISLRMTVLRDEEGVVHFIPHSSIVRVSNLTYGWSRAVFNIRVEYNQDVDKIMGVLMDLAREMRNDETFGPKMLGQPELAGVDEIGDVYVVVKFLVKTRPLQQWAVKRELLRRIKNKFDQLGIRMPMPRYKLEHRGLESLVSEIDDVAANGVFPNRREGAGRSRNGNGDGKGDVRASREYGDGKVDVRASREYGEGKADVRSSREF